MRRWLPFLLLLLATTAFARVPAPAAFSPPTPTHHRLAKVEGRDPAGYGYDDHATTRFPTAKHEATTDTYTYDATGNSIAPTPTLGSQRLSGGRFCGERYDPALGLDHRRARHLNPNPGRFRTMDAYEGNNEDPLSLHKYLYAQDNPVNRIDPSGNVDFSIGSLQVSIGIQSYLGATLASYGVGKGINAAYLAITDGNLSRFEWFETSDLLAFIPGAVLANVVKLPVQMVTRVGGRIVGKAFAQGGVQRVVNGFSQWFASTGGKLVMRSANGAIIELEQGTAKKGFQHLLERHLTAFWNGSKSDITTFWPSNISPGEMLNLLKEASGKYVVGGPAAQSVTLANGITAKLVVHGGKVTTFFPEAGPGVIHAAELLKAVP